jgi:hypothetical protein
VIHPTRSASFRDEGAGGLCAQQGPQAGHLFRRRRHHLRRPSRQPWHEYQDAITYAAWGIDYVKYDWCDSKGLNAPGAYTTMRDAIRSAGRPMLFSMCEWGDNKPWEWARDVGHSWRTTGDIYPCWDCEFSHERSRWA